MGLKKHGKDLSIEAVLSEVINKFQTEPKARKVGSLNDASRYIPTARKRAVLKEDQHQCSYVSRDGVRCTEKHYLNFDHIKPFAFGGKSSSDNLRVLCSAHNQMFNRITFGER